MTLEEAAATLRAAGWTCIPPADPSDVIPEPAVGQVWRSPHTQPKTIISIGPCQAYPLSGDRCIEFMTSIPGHEKWGPFIVDPWGWERWVRNSGARPV